MLIWIFKIVIYNNNNNYYYYHYCIINQIGGICRNELIDLCIDCSSMGYEPADDK